MAHAAIYFEDDEDVPGGVHVKFVPTGEFQKENPAHAMAWRCIQFLDGQAEFKTAVVDELEKKPRIIY